MSKNVKPTVIIILSIIILLYILFLITRLRQLNLEYMQDRVDFVHQQNTEILELTTQCIKALEVK